MPVLALPTGCLRPWRHTDAPALVRAWADPDVAQWNGVPPQPTRATAEHWISGHDVRLKKRLSIDAVIDAPDVGVVGEVGLSTFNEEHNGAQLGYWLLPEGRGQGLATAAVRACVEWAQTTLDLAVIVALCHPANVASQAVVARAGFRLGANDPDGNQVWRSRPRDA